MIRCVRDGRASSVGPRGRRSIHCEFTMNDTENFERRAEASRKADTGMHGRASIRARLSLVHFDSLSVI